jgi:bacteriorhodopsin
MVNTLELRSLNGSLLIQGITLLLNFGSLATPLQPADAILKEILGLETIVQIIELAFYSWYRVTFFEKGSELTRFRYYDWFITTPIMLFSTLCFYVYLDYQEKNTKESNESQEPVSIQSIFDTYKLPILGIFVLNALMLVFGYLQEINVISIVSSSILGYLSLMGSFGILYTQFVQKVPNQAGLFYIMFFVWSLYGVAAMLPSLAKNISYNILDIFAKNFYGIFLSYIIWQKSTSVESVQN